MKSLGLVGGAIGPTVEGEELSSSRFDPFWAKCEELDALLFMHPQDSAVSTGVDKRVRGKGYLENTIGNPLETTIALSHLIFEGTFDRFPKLRICAAHGGGYLASYADRSDAVCVTFPATLQRCLAEEKAERISQANLCGFYRVHAGSAAPPRCYGRRRPSDDRHRLRLSVGEGSGRPRTGDARSEFGGQDRHSRRNRLQTTTSAQLTGVKSINMRTFGWPAHHSRGVAARPVYLAQKLRASRVSPLSSCPRDGEIRQVLRPSVERDSRASYRA